MAQEMTYERACQLVEAVNSFEFWQMGLAERPTPIGKVSLAELCEAARIVREHPGEPTATGRRMRVYPDDRLIAAVFVATHYTPSPSDEASAIVTFPPVGLYRKSVLVLVEVDEEKGGDGDETE